MNSSDILRDTNPCSARWRQTDPAPRRSRRTMRSDSLVAQRVLDDTGQPENWLERGLLRSVLPLDNKFRSPRAEFGSPRRGGKTHR